MRFAPRHLVILGLLALACRPAVAGTDMLTFMPENARVVISLDIEAMKNEPELANTLTMFDQMIAGQLQYENMPTLRDLRSAAIGFQLPADGPEPNYFVAIESAADLTHLSELMAAGGMTPQEVMGRNYYPTEDGSAMLTFSGDMRKLLMSQTVENLQGMMGAAQGVNSLTSGLARPAATGLASPVVYVASRGLEVLMPEIVEQKPMLSQMLIANAQPETPAQQAAVDAIASVLPQLIEANGYEVAIAFDARNMIMSLMIHLRDEKATSAVTSAFNTVRDSAISESGEDAAALQAIKAVQITSAANTVTISTAQPKAPLLAAVPMYAGLAAMQMMQQ
jgi:hypothetical protein